MGFNTGFSPAKITATGGGTAPAGNDLYTTLVYQPSGTAGGNVFTDFTLLNNKAKTMTGVTIMFDDSLGNCEIPPENYGTDWAQQRWIGFGGTPSRVHFQDGVSSNAFPKHLEYIDLRNSSLVPPTGSVFHLTDEHLGSQITLIESEIWGSSGIPLIIASCSMRIYAHQHSDIDNDAISIASGRQVDLYFAGQSEIWSNSIHGSGTLTINQHDSPETFRTQNNHAGRLAYYYRGNGIYGNFPSWQTDSVFGNGDGDGTSITNPWHSGRGATRDVGSGEVFCYDPISGSFTVNLIAPVMAGQWTVLKNVGTNTGSFTIDPAGTAQIENPAARGTFSATTTPSGTAGEVLVYMYDRVDTWYLIN